MGAMKSMIMDTEEQCWDQVSDIIKESKNVSEAIKQASAVFAQAGLIGYLSVSNIDESVNEMWNEQRGAYV